MRIWNRRGYKATRVGNPGINIRLIATEPVFDKSGIFVEVSLQFCAVVPYAAFYFHAKDWRAAYDYVNHRVR